MSTLIDMARKLRPLIEKAVASLDDNDAIEAKILFPNWEAGKTYLENYRVLYKGELYKCLQSHTSSVGYEPSAATSIWKLLTPIKDWHSSSIGYQIDDIVLYQGNKWQSTINNNIWPPTENNFWTQVFD